MQDTKFVLLAALCLPLLAQAQEPGLPETPQAVEDPLFKKLAQAPELKGSSGKWEGALGLGLTLRRGASNSTEGSLSLDALREMRDSRLLANAIAVRSSSNGERSGDTGSADFRGERNINEQMFGFAGFNTERDGLQDLSLRGSLSSGVGVRWLKTESLSLNVYAGLAYSWERYRDEPDARGVEGVLGSELRYELSPTSRITHRAVVYPDSVGGGLRYAMQGDLTTRINAHFGLQVAVLQKYREKVRAENSHADTVVFTGITTAF